jgi:hypothetical protein
MSGRGDRVVATVCLDLLAIVRPESGRVLWERWTSLKKVQSMGELNDDMNINFEYKVSDEQVDRTMIDQFRK